MKDMIQKMSTKQLISVFCVFVLIVSILPLLWIAQYSHLSVDDYCSSLEVKNLWEEHHRIWPVIKEALNHVKSMYLTWQGAYTCSFLLTVQPSAFSYDLYPVTAYINIFLIVFAIFFFVHQLLSSVGINNRQTSIIISSIVSFLYLQMVPAPVEAFYWWTGAITYTALLAVMLIELGLVLKIMNSTKKCIGTMILTFVLTFLSSGGNLVTGLMHVELLWMFFIIACIMKRHHRVFIVILAIFATILLLTNAFCPGNVARTQANMGGNGYSMLASCWYSFGEVNKLLRQWTKPLLIIGSLLTLPLYLKAPILKVFTKRSHAIGLFLFSIVGSYLLMTSAISPVTYGYGQWQPGRVMNVVHLVYVLCIQLVLFTGIQAARCHLKNTSFGRFCSRFIHSKGLVILMVVLVFAFAAVYCFSWFTNRNDYTTMSAINDVCSGVAQQYDYDMEQRHLMLQSDETEVWLPFALNKPHLLFFDDIRESFTDWRNHNIALYYNKEKVYGFVDPSIY